MAADSEQLGVYMDPVEFSQMLAVLHALAPKRCLEWGSGGSTKAVLERCAFIQQWVSIEHDAQWYEKVKALVSDARLSLHLVAPDKPMPPGEHSQDAIIAWAATAEQDPEVMKQYVGLPATLGTTFDFVLVDGRARRPCLKAGYELLSPGGVILLHDAQRTQYHDALEGLGEAVFLEPWKQGQIAFVRKPD